MESMPKCSNCSKEAKKLESYGDILLCKECAKNYDEGNTNSSSKKNNWLIRTTDGHILGPYSHFKLRSLISNKKIVFLDEVSKDGEDWALIKNVDMFKDLALKTDFSLNESTVDIDISKLKKKETKPPVFKKGRAAPVRTAPPAAPKPKKYNESREKVVVQEDTRSFRWIPVFSAVLVVVVLLSGLVYYSTRGPSSKNMFEKADGADSGSDYFNEYYIKGREFEEGGVYKEALQYYRKALAAKPDHAGVRTRKAAIDFLILDNKSEAEKTMQELYTETNIGKISDQEEQCDIKNFLGIFEAKKGNFPAASGYFNQALVIRPTNAYIYYNIGRVLFRQENYSSALEYFHSAKKLSSSFSDAALYEGSTLMKLSRYREAYQVFSEAVLQNPNVREFYVLGAYAASKAYTNEKAFSILKKILSVDPYYYKKVFTPLYQLDKDNSIKGEINCVIEIMKSLSEGQKKQVGYILSLLYFIDGNTDAAMKYIPSDLNGADASGLLVSGIISFQQEHYDEAEKKIDKSLELDYSNSVAHLYAGEIALQNNDLGQARNHFTKAQSTDEATSLYATTLLGDVLFKSNYGSEALILWKKVISLDSHYLPAWERVLNYK